MSYALIYFFCSCHELRPSTGGEIGSVKYDGGYAASYDETYKDYDGRTSIRIITPCDGDITSPECLWYDGNDGPKMQKQRWYPGAESLPDGSVVLIGGFVSGGYVNRNTPNVNPAGDGSEPTFEFYPSRGEAKVMDFMVKTSGLNAYALTYLMPSGKMLVQANYSTSTYKRFSFLPLCTSSNILNLSSVGLREQCRDAPSRNAWQDYPCLPRVWCQRNAAAHA